MVAHRVAFLLRVKRVKPRAILVLCFNRSAVASLRRRLRELVGDDMNGVTTLTFHGLALRLTGRSLVTAGRAGNADIDFSGVIRDAVKLLGGEKEVLGLGDGPVRDALIGTFSHILVDEYQDIDGEQYELVALLAGKNLDEKDRKMTILAVGDDDQNIYRFRGANVGFIRKFHGDYEAAIHYLIENYRSTANIIGAANCLIAHNSDRMKTGHPIRINVARSELPAGGNWQSKDPVAGGRVQRLAVAGQDDQAWVVLEEIRRLQLLESSFDLESCAVLAREWKDLDKVRAVLESAGIPVSFTWGRGDSFPRLTRIRENAVLLEYLRNNRQAMETASSLLSFLPKKAGEDSVWQANLRRLIDDWRYTFLGLEDMYLDFAGMKKEHHPVRQALRGLGVGDSVTAELRGGHIELVDGSGLSVARLSKAARDIWQGRLSSIAAVRIVAMVRRYREDIADREYGERCHGDFWELPV
ncbi:MAG: ATP-dependent DNA helicase protein, partial [uncultured bacterium]